MDTEIRIVRDALRLFRLYGIRSLSLEDIAQFIWIPVKDLRRYFSTKDRLLQKCAKYWISQEEIFKYTDDHLLDILINFADAYPLLYRKVNCRTCVEIKKYYPQVADFFYEYLERYALACQGKLEEAIAFGYIRRTISSRLIYTFFTGYLMKLFVVDANRDLGEESDCTRQTILAFTRGIVTEKGRGYMDKRMKKE